jgi:hypothetical protein
VVSAGCADGARLDDARIGGNDRMELRVVRYHENKPLHFVGAVYRVQCRSSQTTDAPSARMHEPGWANVTNGSAIGAADARELAQRLARGFHVLSQDVFVLVQDDSVITTFDQCRSFQSWRAPSQLPFVTDDLQLEGPRTLSFKALAPGGAPAIRVRTSDAGATWHTEPVPPDAAIARTPRFPAL